MRIAVRAALALTLTAFIVSGCSIARRQPEAPRASVPSGSAVPQPPLDVFSIPDAVPRAEPRGTRGNPPFYEVFGKRYYVLASSEGFVERAKKALNAFPPSEARDALLYLPEYVIARDR